MDSPHHESSPVVAATEGYATVPAAGQPVGPLLIWVSAVAAGLLVGVLAWGAGELTKDAFQPKLVKVQVLLQTFITSTLDTEHDAAKKNAALAFAIFGCVTGMVMGLAGGIASRAVARGVVVGLGAGALGGILTALSSWLILPYFFAQLAPNPNNFLFPIVIQGAIWLDIGAIGGIAFALGIGEVRRVPHALVGGCAGALLGTVLFHLVAAMAYQDSEFTEPLAKVAIVRLIARVLVSLFAAIGIARAVQSGAHASVKERAPTSELA